MYKDYPESYLEFVRGVEAAEAAERRSRIISNAVLMVLGAVIALLFIIAFFWATAAHAEDAPAQVCAPYKQVSDGLKQKFHEEETSLGAMMDGQAALVLFTAPEGKTWTLVVVGINGRTCIVASGDNWSQGDMPKAGRPA